MKIKKAKDIIIYYTFYCFALVPILLMFNKLKVKPQIFISAILILMMESISRPDGLIYLEQESFHLR